MSKVMLPDRSDEDNELYDALTGLPGRLLQRAHLVHALRRADRNRTNVAVLFIDVDDFATLNERVGRDVADQVLVTLAGRIQSALRGTDMAARLDGDEFTIVCEDIADERDLAMVARRVADSASTAMRIGDQVIELQVTTGTALSDGQARAGALLNEANRDMLERKAGHPRP